MCTYYNVPSGHIVKGTTAFMYILYIGQRVYYYFERDVNLLFIVPIHRAK